MNNVNRLWNHFQLILLLWVTVTCWTHSSTCCCEAFLVAVPAGAGSHKRQPCPRTNPALSWPLSLSTSITTSRAATVTTHQRIDIDETFDGIKKIHSNPDIFIIQNFLELEYCKELIEKARDKKMAQSPVAYAGKTDDMRELIELAAKGPVAWLSILIAWLQVKDEESVGQIQLLLGILQNYAVGFLMAAAIIVLFVRLREDGLQELRTSTSTTLGDLNVKSTREFVKRSADLFNTADKDEKRDPAKQAIFFEAPTVIRYEPGQSLAPHYDANRSAETEDANRGGQTLATLLLYLNDVAEGGKTRFGLISSSSTGETCDDDGKLVVQPKAGDALLFFPADRNGEFDDRLEHEGCPAIDTKWVARIWRHMDRVPPPFGLSNSELLKL